MQELNDLKNLVIQSLEANGSLSNIRAQIRASVFKVIDQPDGQQQQPKKPSPFSWENQKCQSLLQNENGILVMQIIKEFLQFYKMDYSNGVFSSESNLREEIKRDKLHASLPLVSPDPQKPLLLLLVEQFKSLSSGNGSAAPAVVTEAKSAAPISAAAAVPESKNPETKVQNLFPSEANAAPTSLQQQQKYQIEQPQEDEEEEQDHDQEGHDIDDFDQQQFEDEELSEQSREQENSNRKQTIQDAEKLIQMNQAQLRSGQIASLPIGQSPEQLQKQQQQQQQQQQPSATSSKFNHGGYDYEDDDENRNSEDVEEQLAQYNEDDIDLEYQEEQKKLHNRLQQQNQLDESEDFIGQSSKGQDVSVDSYQLEDYDYVTDVEEGEDF